MSKTLKAWKDVDGEIIYIEEGESGEGIIGPGFTRVPGSDRVVADDLQTADDFYTKTELDAGQLDTRYYTQSQVDVIAESQNEASEITTEAITSITASNVQAVLQRLNDREVIKITQNAHGFVLTNNIPVPAYINTSTGLIEPARADDKDTLTALYVIEVTDINNIVIRAGEGVHESIGHGLLQGHYYFLSDTIAGDVVIDTPTGKYDDVAFYVIDSNLLLIKDNRPVDVDSLQKWLIKTTHDATASGLDFDGTAVIEVPLTTSTLIEEKAGYYNIVGNGIQVTETRTYRLSIHIPFVQSGTNDRKRLRGRFYVNGNPAGAIFNSQYGRGSNGDQNWSCTANEILILSENDVVTFRTNRQTTDGTGTILLDGVGTSYFMIEVK